MKQYFIDKYAQIKEWLKKEKWFLLLLLFMTFSLFVSMFTEYALIACVVLTFVCSIIFNFEHNLGFFLFSQAFEAILTFFLNGKKIRVYSIVYSIIFLVCCLKHLIRVIQKKEKINLKMLLLISVIILYLILTMNDRLNVVQIFKHLVAFAFIYLIFIESNKFNFNNIIIWACVGLILSIILEHFAYGSERMVETMGMYFNDGVRKTQAMFPNPNIFAMYAVLVVACVLYKTIFEDILWIIPFIIIFAHSYETLSRNYILNFIFAFMLVCILVCIKHNKKYFLKFMITLFLIIIVCLSHLNISKTYINRMTSVYNEFCLFVGIDSHMDKVFLDIGSNMDEYLDAKPNPGGNPNSGSNSDGLDNSTSDSENGKWIDGTPIDPGRSGLWKRYLKDYTKSTKVILFGRGADANVLGMQPHNSFIELIWRYGIIGVLLFSSIFYFIAKELFKGKTYLSLIILGQTILTNLFESCIFNFMSIFMLVLLVVSSIKINKIEKEEKEINNSI